MKRVELAPTTTALLAAAKRMSGELEIENLLMLTERPLDFAFIKERLAPKVSLIVASSEEDVVAAATADDVEVVALSHEPQGRQAQLTQAIVDSLADEYLPAHGRLFALYPNFEKDGLDTLSIISLTEQLTKLTSRDLQRLETQVPLDVLRRVIDLAVEIGREGREAKKVGTIFVVGDHRRVLELSHEQIHDPFRGYTKKERGIRSSRVRESIKELSQIDGAFVVANDGSVVAAGRILNPGPGEITLSTGLGARHVAAAGISKSTKAVAIAVSESTGTVRVFQDGKVVLRIEPMDQAMMWHD